MWLGFSINSLYNVNYSRSRLLLKNVIWVFYSDLLRKLLIFTWSFEKFLLTCYKKKQERHRLFSIVVRRISIIIIRPVIPFCLNFLSWYSVCVYSIVQFCILFFRTLFLLFSYSLLHVVLPFVLFLKSYTLQL